MFPLISVRPCVLLQMSGKGKVKVKTVKRGVVIQNARLLSGSKRKPASSIGAVSEKRARSATPEVPQTPTAQLIVLTAAESPVKIQKPAAAAAAAAAAASADDTDDLCTRDEKSLPESLPLLDANRVVTYIGALTLLVRPDDTPVACAEGQVLHHISANTQLALQKCTTSISAESDYQGPSAATLSAGNVYVPGRVLSSRITGQNLVVQVTRLSDSALFAMKLMPNHSVYGTSTHEQAYLSERRAVLRAVGACDAAHVVRIYSFNMYDKDTPCATLRMQLMGNSMQNVMFHRQNSAPDVLMALGDMLAAAATVHRAGIVHGAAFASNFLCDPQTGAWKLGDFESAAMAVSTTRGGKLWLTASASRRQFHKASDCIICGAKDVPPLYRAPEHASLEYTSQSIITGAMDIWSIGMILFCLVTRGFPFDDGASYEEVDRALAVHFSNEAVLFGTFRKAAVVECGFAGQQLEDLCDLFKQMLARNPEDRVDASGALRSRLFTARRLFNDAAAPAVTAGDTPVPASPYVPETPMTPMSSASPPVVSAAIGYIGASPALLPETTPRSPSLLEMDPPALAELQWASPTGAAAAAASMLYTPVLGELLSAD